MRQREKLDKRFDELELALESLELHLLQAVWNLEIAVQASNKNQVLLRDNILSMIRAIDDSQVRQQDTQAQTNTPSSKFESDRLPLENVNPQIR